MSRHVKPKPSPNPLIDGEKQFRLLKYNHNCIDDEESMMRIISRYGWVRGRHHAVNLAMSNVTKRSVDGTL